MSDSPATRIEREVASWPGVSVEPHRFGGVEFRVGRRELGHLHGSRLADLPFSDQNSRGTRHGGKGGAAPRSSEERLGEPSYHGPPRCRRRPRVVPAELRTRVDAWKG